MAIFEQHVDVTELCNQADLASARFLEKIPKALTKHPLDTVLASLKSEVRGFGYRLTAALSTLPQDVLQAIGEATKSAAIEETRELLQQQIDAVLITSTVADDARTAVLPDLINHRRRFAKMRAVLAQTNLWNDPSTTTNGSAPSDTIDLDVLLGGTQQSSLDAQALAKDASSLDLNDPETQTMRSPDPKAMGPHAQDEFRREV